MKACKDSIWLHAQPEKKNVRRHVQVGGDLCREEGWIDGRTNNIDTNCNFSSRYSGILYIETPTDKILFIKQR